MLGLTAAQSVPREWPRTARSREKLGQTLPPGNAGETRVPPTASPRSTSSCLTCPGLPTPNPVYAPTLKTWGRLDVVTPTQMPPTPPLKVSSEGRSVPRVKGCVG